MTVNDQAQWLQRGFADPLLDAQISFRAALNALAEPGTVQRMDKAQGLGALDQATYSLCLALLDNDTAVWLAPCFDTAEIRANLAFHCGCEFVSDRSQASFALLDQAALGDLSGFYIGSERFPDQSCTLFIQLDSLVGGSLQQWSGPGINGVRDVTLPLPLEFWQQRAARNAFPRGLDCLFSAQGSVVGLPRSTRITPMVEEVA